MSGRNNETKLQTALGCAGGLRPAGGGMDTTAGRLGVYPFYQWHRIFSEHTNSAGTVHGLGVGAVAVDSWNLSGEPDFACSYPLLHGGTKAAFRAGDVRGAESSGRSRGQPGIIFSTHPRFGTDCGCTCCSCFWTRSVLIWTTPRSPRSWTWTPGNASKSIFKRCRNGGWWTSSLVN